MIAVTYLFSAIAVVMLPWRKPDLWRASPASKVKLFGVPIVPVSGVITIGLLVFCLYEWLTNADYFVNNHVLAAIYMGAMYVLAIVHVRGRPRRAQAAGHRPRPHQQGDPGRVASSSSMRKVPAPPPAFRRRGRCPAGGRKRLIGGIQRHE